MSAKMDKFNELISKMDGQELISIASAYLEAEQLGDILSENLSEIDKESVIENYEPATEFKEN